MHIVSYVIQLNLDKVDRCSILIILSMLSFNILWYVEQMNILLSTHYSNCCTDTRPYFLAKQQAYFLHLQEKLERNIEDFGVFPNNITETGNKLSNVRGTPTVCSASYPTSFTSKSNYEESIDKRVTSGERQIRPRGTGLSHKCMGDHIDKDGIPSDMELCCKSDKHNCKQIRETSCKILHEDHRISKECVLKDLSRKRYKHTKKQRAVCICDTTVSNITGLSWQRNISDSIESEDI